jgi:Protein of unknown function (DUF2934)
MRVNEKAILDPRRIEILAHEFWRARGCPEGSPDEDWFLAEEQLRHRPRKCRLVNAAIV